MFPTFISILDIQSWWEVPSIAHFCSLFRTAFNLLDFDIEDLEEALLTDGTEETSWLQELIVRLLSGCLPNNEISTSNYQMFLRRLFRQKCQEHDRYNPFNTDHDFQLLPLRTKVDILHALCDFRLDADDVLEQLKNLEADSLRVEPLGYDSNSSAYWYFYGTRLYREDNNSTNKKKSIWQVVCFTEDDWFGLSKKLKRSVEKCERQLYRTLSENFLPELPRLFREKERLARKRLLEKQPRRCSSRLRKENSGKDGQVYLKPPVDERRGSEESKRETYEKRHKSDSSDISDEMGGSKFRQKKLKNRQRKLSNSSSTSKDDDCQSKHAKKKKITEKAVAASSMTTVGRQTNNSLAAATGQIVINPSTTVNTQKKKLKTSQVFRQTDEDLVTGMHKILDSVKNHEDAWPFADPVEEEYAPNYYTVIRKPMDLQRMEDRLDAGYYKNFDKFRDDFHLIVDNCRLYNGAENEYTEMVDNLSKVFKRATEKFLDAVSSSDDEIAVEFPNNIDDDQEMNNKTVIKRKPSLAATKLDKKLHGDEKKTNQTIDNLKTKKRIKIKKEKSPSRSRSQSRNSIASSPPPSSIDSSSPSISKRFDFFPKKRKHENDDQKNKRKEKSSSSVLAEEDTTNSCDTPNQKMSLNSKPKDKHNKLRETIERLKAKSEIGSKLNDDVIFSHENVELKENKITTTSRRDVRNNKNRKEKNRRSQKKDGDGDSNSLDETNDNKKRKNSNKNVKNAAIEALTIATEQTLKDINKWLDDTPKFSEYSSASNSPCYPINDDFEMNKNEEVIKKKILHNNKRDIIKRRALSRDQNKFVKKREIQRTIDRLQPGKSKGNLISSVQQSAIKPTEEMFPSLLTNKNKDAKNSLIVKTDDNAPKLSLGSVLDSFGRHKFIDENDTTTAKKPPTPETKLLLEEAVDNKKKPDERVVNEETMMSSATPNLSAWFKAFGAPKVASSTSQKKNEDGGKKDEASIVEVAPRQRRMSTGSSVSERSSFSQDLDSPRVGIDERLGSYPAPYPSPLHRSPTGASPQSEVPTSPKTQQQQQYPPFNGQIRVGFYQDTVSNKSSPDKSHSPRDNAPQSPYQQCPPTEQIYVQNVATVAQNYSYPPSPYYTSGQYGGNSEGYYDTNKSLTEQYQTKTQTSYTLPEVAPTSNQLKSERLVPNSIFPVKKRAYNDSETDESLKHYVHQNVQDSNNKAATEPPEPVINYSYNNTPYNTESNAYTLNVPSRPLTSSSTKLLPSDIAKYTNMGYSTPMQNYRNDLYARPPSTDQQGHLHYNHDMSSSTEYTNPNEVAIPRPSYNHLEMEQPISLRGNITNLSHIVDRYGNDERMYYGDKPLGTTHMFNKTFNQNVGIQSYNQNMAVSSTMYNRQMADLQNTVESKSEKKTKKRKSTKSNETQPAPSSSTTVNQGFQSYANIKSTDSNAISLKTASVVPGSAFNFGPAAPLYDNPNFLDDFRATAPNYYSMAAAAAAAKPTPDATAARQAAATNSTYSFAQAAAATPPNYFMPSTQAPPPLYQHYLQAGVLNHHQGLLAPHHPPPPPHPGAYASGYHALSMRQQYESMTRPPWL